MYRRSAITSALAVLGFAYAYGLLLGALSLVYEVVFRNGAPHMPWWQWLLAPFAIGAFAMGGEWLFQKLQDKTGFGVAGESRAKHAIHLVVLFLVLALLIVGPALYKVSHQ